MPWQFHTCPTVHTLKQVFIQEAGSYQGLVIGRYIAEVSVSQVENDTGMNLESQGEEAPAQASGYRRRQWIGSRLVDLHRMIQSHIPLVGEIILREGKWPVYRPVQKIYATPKCA